MQKCRHHGEAYAHFWSLIYFIIKGATVQIILYGSTGEVKDYVYYLKSLVKPCSP